MAGKKTCLVIGAGAGIGGTVHLLANGGTIDSAGAALTVSVNGVSGNGGGGGSGSGGDGSCCSGFVDQGGELLGSSSGTTTFPVRGKDEEWHGSIVRAG